jgi:hypothetical protein
VTFDPIRNPSDALIMTDAEIRKQLAEQIEAEGRVVVVESPDDGPPLLLIAKRHLSMAQVQLIHETFQDAWTYRSERGPARVVVDAGLDVFQLIDGQWRKLD